VDCILFFFFFQAEDGIRDFHVTGVQTCALPISSVPLDSAPSVNRHRVRAGRKGLVLFGGVPPYMQGESRARQSECRGGGRDGRRPSESSRMRLSEGLGE